MAEGMKRSVYFHGDPERSQSWTRKQGMCMYTGETRDDGYLVDPQHIGTILEIYI